MAFNTEPEKISEISQYEFYGTDEMGLSVASKGKRVVISISCRLDYAVYGDDEYYDYNYSDEEEEEGEADDGAGETGNYLLDLLAKNREYLKNGDYRLLYGIWQLYGMAPDDEEEFEEEVPPEPTAMDQLPQPIETLLSLLDK